MLERVLRRLDSLERTEKSTPCVIMYKGEQLKMPSGKTAWRNAGDARKALANAVFYFLDYGDKQKIKEQGFSSPVDYLEKEGHVEFVDSKPLSDQDKRDLEWLRCLESAGVDNWDGVDYAYEMFNEIYPED